MAQVFGLKTKIFSLGEYYNCRAAAVAANSGVSTLRHKGLIEVLPTTLLSLMVAHVYSRDDCSDGGIT